VKLGDGRIYNADDIKDPLVRRGKGRSTTKCLKASTEENNKAGTSKKYQANIGSEDKREEVVEGRKCGLCHETGHYAPRCPNKEN
jgi:hypothetical protein